VSRIAVTGGFDTPKATALVVLAALAGLIAIKRGFRGVTVSVGS
jgi:hypothetical protein